MIIYKIKSIIHYLHFHLKIRRNWNFWHRLCSCRCLDWLLELRSLIFCVGCVRSIVFLHQISNWRYLLLRIQIIFDVYFLLERLKNRLFLCCWSYRLHDLLHSLSYSKDTVKCIFVGCDNLVSGNAQTDFMFDLYYLHSYLFAFVQCLWCYSKASSFFLRDCLFGYSSWFSYLNWNSE